VAPPRLVLDDDPVSETGVDRLEVTLVVCVRQAYLHAVVSDEAVRQNPAER